MDDTINLPPGVLSGDIVSWGSSAVVAQLTDKTVIKCPFGGEASRSQMETEKRIYERLTKQDSHNCILRYYGSSEYGIILGYACNGTLRGFMKMERSKEQPLPDRLRWSRQLAESLRFVHSKGVLHGDICCNNVFLDENLDLRLGDFGGSSIDGRPAVLCYEASHRHPDISLKGNISLKSEFFALGSTIYEIMTGSAPYAQASSKSIKDFYARGVFPKLDHLDAFTVIIAKCWGGCYNSMDEVMKDIEAEGMYSHSIHSMTEIDSL
ncbi:hypothetical protein GP486_004062 [Trichoglossum hirsutum]|uniref:EKC/KEOPS complex subunit BUD32 n=1 Tax=Trichoglossum hirsutum TaxID=265104 RepID=A0A9P8LBW6_9PEZI|nr:hypothetical protein GP486_004062 [Trichoglossum hirsutum]